MDPPVQAARRMWSVSAGARERAALRPSANRPCGRRVSRVVDRPISHDRLRVRPPPYQAASSRAKRHWFWSWAAGGSRPVPLHRGRTTRGWSGGSPPALDAGLDPERYSGHSLRADLAAVAGDAGAGLAELMRQTRHKSNDVAAATSGPSTCGATT